MFSKQKRFKYRDKLDKHLSRILTEYIPKFQIPDMVGLGGVTYSHSKDKLRLFYENFKTLYSSSDPQEIEIR